MARVQGNDAGSLTASPAEGNWSLTPLREAERPLLARLLEQYLYDFSDFTGWSVQEDGLFASPDWYERQWSTPGRHVLLLRVAGKPAGFAIVDERSPLPGGENRHYIAEFFVMRAHRRRRLGAAVARTIFDHFPGGWHVLQMPRNTTAQAFWRRVISDYTGGQFTEQTITDGDIVQEFDTRDKASR